ncbi:MAG: dynamin family protein [Synergistaceae bacterium]|jgi:hypothetical protein|nr:dynamin family protein [Synergistaceae bacterium]
MFELTDELSRQFDALKEQTARMTGRIAAYDAADAAEMTRFTENFGRKTRDFFSAERRLNIGVVGQVKAGKSSFLNTLLFDGRSVLPKASTPKTANLTKIEYAEENAMVVEYYSADDWDAIEDNARVGSIGAEYEAARELVKMAEASGIDAASLARKGRERTAFQSYDELMERLNDYVGENGRYTAFVKAVILYANNPAFRDLSIVDTPGLNDPVQSRTLRTKEFMELCDVVFFLSPCGAFLDKSDWVLLSTQIPQKGVKRLVLIGSKFDSGLRDVLRKTDPDDPFGADPNTADNIPAAIAMVKRKLTSRAAAKIDEFKKDLRRREADEAMIRVLGECRAPFFVSAMAQNMRGRDPSSFDVEEANVYAALAEFSANLPGELPEVGGFEAVRRVRDEVVSEKDAILSEKSASFIPTARGELTNTLSAFKEKARMRIAKLNSGDRKQLMEQRDDVMRRINAVRADIETALGEWKAKVESAKIEGSGALREGARGGRTLEERTGTETKTGSYRVSDSTWYKPWTWGSSHREYYTYEESYSYLAASDAVDNIRNFVSESEGRIEQTFAKAVNHQEMKRRLLAVASANFDMSDERYDPSLFRLLVTEHINRVEFPVIRVDCSSAVDAIASRFSGQLRSGEDQSALRKALDGAVDAVFGALVTRFEEAAAAFKSALSEIGSGLQSTLLKDINDEFEKILILLDEKDASVKKLSEYAVELEAMLKQVR